MVKDGGDNYQRSETQKLEKRGNEKSRFGKLPGATERSRVG